MGNYLTISNNSDNSNRISVLNSVKYVKLVEAQSGRLYRNEQIFEFPSPDQRPKKYLLHQIYQKL